MEKFLIGALVGGIAGALVVSNNAKMRMIVKKGEDGLKEKIGTMMDEKLSEVLEKCNAMSGGATESETDKSEKAEAEGRGADVEAKTAREMHGAKEKNMQTKDVQAKIKSRKKQQKKAEQEQTA